MKTNIQFVHSEPNYSAEQLVQKKLDKLEDKFDWIISADVLFKMENDAAGKGKVCAIELQLPGPRIHASSNNESFEAAAAATINDIKRQLVKRKEEMKSY